LHIHALVRLPKCAHKLSPPDQSEIMKSHWANLRPKGTSDRQRVYDCERLSGYVTKQIANRDHFANCIILSSEFHNHN
jgi:hypothetical protein